jgi:hypothetical protein
MAVRSVLCAGRPLPPRKILYLFFLDADLTQAIVQLKGLGKLKQFSDLNGNRT